MKARALGLLLLLLAGCGMATHKPTPTTPTPTTPTSVAGAATPTSAKPSVSGSRPSPRPTVSSPGPTAGRTGTMIIVADSRYGPMLYDASGQAIYLFDAERTARPECFGDCAAAWPPVLTDGGPRAGNGVKADLLGTTERRGGTTQVTYAGHPLYYYADEGKYEVLCHNIEGFGGTWLVVQPDGNPAPV